MIGGLNIMEEICRQQTPYPHRRIHLEFELKNGLSQTRHQSEEMIMIDGIIANLVVKW